MPEKPRPNSQEVAAIFARYLARAEARRHAVRTFTLGYEGGGSILKTRRLAKKHLSGKDSSKNKGLSEKGREILDEIFEDQLAQEEETVEGKIGKFTIRDRTKLLFRAKLKRVSGLTDDERDEMYREAGYSEDEIKGVTGKNLASSVAVTAGLTALSEGVRGGGVVFDKFIPLVEQLPGKTGVLLSAGGYTAAYVLFAWESRRLTEKTGTSANASVTGLYAMADKLLPNKARDVIAVGIPVAMDAAVHTAAYTAGVGAATGDLDKITAGNVTSIGLTLAFAGGSEVWLRRKMRKENKTKQG
jgi:hypothetical protein